MDLKGNQERKLRGAWGLQWRQERERESSRRTGVFLNEEGAREPLGEGDEV
jgi:hypothetical protein